MTIGQTIRHYRKQLCLTQAQLADRVGVSAQAISKWETGAGFPDVSQIVPLARALCITTDTLFQFTHPREEFEKLWHDTLDRTHGDPRKTREVSRAALAVYPEDKVFLLRASMDEEQLAELTEDEGQRTGHLHSALLHCRRLLETDPEDPGNRLHLVRLLSRLGLDDEAFASACQLRGRDRDLALKYCLKGDALTGHRQKLVDRKFRVLLTELMEGDPAMLDAAEGMILAAIPDGNYQHYGEFLAGIYLKRFAHARAAGDGAAACAAARQVLELAKTADGIPHRSFTAPLLDHLENINSDLRPDRVWRWLLSYVEEEVPQWREDPDLEPIISSAYAYLKETQLP